MLSQSVQDYLKTIYKLQEHGVVSTTAIANSLDVSGASVTGMLKRLAKMELVDYNSYKGVKLSDRGNKIALEIIRHHRLIELYLKEELGYSLDRVHEEACRLEHVISEEFANKIAEKLGNPKFDPHGHPIPAINGTLPEQKEINLTDVDPGKKTEITRLCDGDEKLLAYLEKNGLVPGAKIDVTEKAPFHGPVTIRHQDVEKIIGNEVAKNIFVKIKK